MPTPVAAVESGDIKNPLDSDGPMPSGEIERGPSAKIRLVRWFSSHKQVFVAELLLRSTGRSD
jgi:hypothetical protein